ncbi:MAG: hypothetical protein QNJ04_12730 [Desulfobacterales bacterium]|nr:hypothetical protein [Desulfobacterales bacterium]
MFRFYSSRELSRMLMIPLNRWKRWSREFLPPDPLGGLQSGYARQFSSREAFIVYLGGYMVSGLGLSIPLARQVIDDLRGWLKDNILDGHFVRHAAGDGSRVDWPRYEIHILDKGKASAVGSGTSRLTYHIREIESRLNTPDANLSRRQESYTETILKASPEPVEGGFPPVRRLLDITDLADRFASLLKSQ